MSYDQIPNLPQIISLSSDTLLEGAQAGSSGKLSIGQIVSFANAQANIYTDQLLLEELGVVGNGTGDQSSAIVAALIYANGKKLVGTPGSTYRITNTIEYTGTYNIDWAGSSIVCDADVIAMDINSGISGVYYLSDDYSVGTTDLPMAETGIDIVQGRKIKIISDAIDPSNRDSGSSSSQYRLTEWFVSGPGSTQTNIVLQAPLSDTIGINPVSVPGEESRVQAYTTALNARLIVLPESVSFSDSNMKLSYSSGKTWNKTAVFVRGFDNPIFNNISINNSYDSGLAISGCYNPVINNPKTTNIIQYGIAFSGSFGGMVTNPYVENSRHGITTSSSKATASSTNMNTLLAVGRNPNTFISGGYGGGNPGFAPFDTHHDAKDFVFSNQHTKDTGGFAMQARGTGHKFLSPIVRNSEYGLLALTEYGSGDPDDDYFTAGKLPGDVTNLQIDSPDIEVDSQAVVANTAYLFLSGVGLYSSVDPRVIWSNGSKIVISGDHNFVVDAGNAISGQGLIEVNAVNPIMTTAIDIAEVVIDGSVTIDARFATGGVVEGISADAGTRVVINGTLTLMMPSDSGNLFAGSGEIVTRNAGIVRYSKEGGPDSGQALNITGRNIRCEAIDGTSSSRMIANVPFSSRSAAQSAYVPSVQRVLSYNLGDKILQFRRDNAGTALTTMDGGNWSPANEYTPWHFGATGGSDDTVALQAWIYAIQGRVGVVPEGSYFRISSELITDTDYTSVSGTGSIEQLTFGFSIFQFFANNCSVDGVSLINLQPKTVLSPALSARFWGDTSRARACGIYNAGNGNTFKNIKQYGMVCTINNAGPRVWTKNVTISGATLNTFPLKSQDQKVDGFYIGSVIRILGGTDSDYKTIIDYDGTTNTVTVSDNWTSAQNGSGIYYVIWIERQSKTILQSITQEKYDFGILGTWLDDFFIDGLVSRDGEQTQESSAPPHAIYITGDAGDIIDPNKGLRSRNIFADGLHCIKHVGAAYKFRAVDGMLLGDMYAEGCRGIATIEHCTDTVGAGSVGRNLGKNSVGRPVGITVTGGRDIKLGIIDSHFSPDYIKGTATVNYEPTSVLIQSDLDESGIFAQPKGVTWESVKALWQPADAQGLTLRGVVVAKTTGATVSPAVIGARGGSVSAVGTGNVRAVYFADAVNGFCSDTYAYTSDPTKTAEFAHFGSSATNCDVLYDSRLNASAIITNNGTYCRTGQPNPAYQDTYNPQGHLVGTGVGWVLGQQGSAATLNGRGDVFDGLNMVRDRISGVSGTTTLFRGWSYADDTGNYIALNPYGNKIRAGGTLVFQIGSSTTRFSIDATGMVTAATVKTTAVAVSALPAAATAGAGARAFVNNSSVTTYGAIVAGSGSSFVPVYSDGTNWRIG